MKDTTGVGKNINEIRSNNSLIIIILKYMKYRNKNKSKNENKNKTENKNESKYERKTENKNILSY